MLGPIQSRQKNPPKGLLKNVILCLTIKRINQKTAKYTVTLISNTKVVVIQILRNRQNANIAMKFSTSNYMVCRAITD